MEKKIEETLDRLKIVRYREVIGKCMEEYAKPILADNEKLIEENKKMREALEKAFEIICNNTQPGDPSNDEVINLIEQALKTNL